MARRAIFLGLTQLAHLDCVDPSHYSIPAVPGHELKWAVRPIGYLYPDMLISIYFLRIIEKKKGYSFY